MTLKDKGERPAHMNRPAIPYRHRIRQMYWCRFPETEFLNEFGSDGKQRPVVIISKKNRLHGTAIVVPFSTVEQTRPELSVKLKSPLNGMDTRAVCSHPMTVSTYRLTPDRHRGVVRMPQNDFQMIKKKVQASLPD